MSGICQKQARTYTDPAGIDNKMLSRFFLKRKVNKYLDKYSLQSTNAEMFMSWQVLIGVAQKDWDNTYIPAKQLYLMVIDWHKKNDRAHLVDAMNELNRSFQIKVMEDLNSEFLDHYRVSKDSSDLEFANNCLRNASKIRSFPKKDLHISLSNYLGG